jgi:hypothetical protein
MSKRLLTFVGVVAVAFRWLAPVPVAGQAQQAAAKARTTAAKAWIPPRAPDGHPDLQGIWSFATITPLERPTELAGQQVLTDEQAAEFEKQTLARTNADRRDGGTQADVSRAYNDFWYDRGTKVVGTRRTSLIVDPPDGKVPPFTAEAQKRAQARAEGRRRRGPADDPEDRALSERCILGFNSGPPMVPGGYNQNVQLLQTRDYVVIHNEMIHSARIVPMDGRPHGTVRQLVGDSRGRWEGDTLVVDTTNLTDETNFRGSTAKLHLIERFTPVDADTLLYEFTADDPATWTAPWTAQIPLTKTPGPIFEYACHEGNYGLEGILRGTRAEEKAAAEAARKGSK